MAPTKTPTKPLNVASLDYDDMVMGGLPDDFSGRVTKVRFVPWNYAGTRSEYSLAVRVDYEPDGDSGIAPFSSWYSCGSLQLFVPSKDGVNPVDIEGWDGEESTVDQVEGIYALKVGSRTVLDKGSMWAHWTKFARDAGFPKEKLTSAVNCYEGITGHFNRIPPEGMGTLRTKADGKKSPDPLVPTDIKSVGKVTGKASTKATSASAGTNGSSLDDRLSDVIVAAISEAGGEIKSDDLKPIIVAEFAGADKVRALRRYKETDFIEGSDLWIHDEGVLQLSE